MKRIRKMIRERMLLTSIVAVVVLTGIYFIFFRSEDAKIPTLKVTRGTITQEISVTGKTKPVQDVDLAFEKSGKITLANVRIGDKVVPGQLLVQLDTAELAAQLLEAQANALTQKAKLDELKRGTRAEDIKIKESELRKAEQDLANHYANVDDTVNESYAKADDAIRKQTDLLFTNDEELNPQLSFSTNNTQLKINVEQGRSTASQGLNMWRKTIDALNVLTSPDNLTTALREAKQRLNLLRDFLNDLMDVVTNANGISQTTLDTYKTNIATARTNINGALSSVASLEQTIASQKITVEKIRDELNLKLAGSAPEEIRAQEAQLAQAEAKAQTIEAQLAKNTLRSPISGIITKQDAKVGEIVGANNPIVSIISGNNFEIEANIPEADIVKIKVGNTARITLDAYGSEVTFEASVVKIDPAETIVEGVTTYKTTLQFGTKDERVKSHMTANIEILTARKENVIAIPQRAVGTKDGGKFVRIVRLEKTEEVKIETGLQGSNGTVEVTMGLNEGDEIITSRNE
ncbi:MAG: efflux RND transporter periplasmic adaptor subunit [Patescibacteria group bacterium]